MKSTSNNQSLADRRNAAIPAALGQHLHVYIDRAENAELWDVEGRRYIDFAAGIAVNNTGHRHPRVIAAVTEQLSKFTHTSFQTTGYPEYIELCERLNALVPGPGEKKSFLVSTGAEATENAIKIARAYTGRPGFIAFNGAFHGRTMMAMTLTGKVSPYKAGFGAMVPDVFRAPFPVPYRGVDEAECLLALRNMLKYDVDPTRIAGIVLEPMQGEGGFNPATPSFVQALRALCDEHGMLLIADEIQTGFARTGKMFAMEHMGAYADIVTMAKGLGGGFPLAAVTARAEIFDKVPNGGLGGTFAGSPVSCAAALAVLDILADEGLVDRAREIGERTRAKFKSWAARDEFACIGDVRGLGAMNAIEFVHDRQGKAPWPELVRAVVDEAAKNGLLLLTCGVYGNAIRVLTPLTIPFELLDEGFDVFERALKVCIERMAKKALAA